MLWTLALILFVLWLLGTVSAYTMGGLIHGLLVLALILVVLNLFTGTRRTALSVDRELSANSSAMAAASRGDARAHGVGTTAAALRP